MARDKGVDSIAVRCVKNGDDDGDGDESDTSDGDDGVQVTRDSNEAAELGSGQEPEVDEDGFTKVVSKRRR